MAGKYLIMETSYGWDVNWEDESGERAEIDQGHGSVKEAMASVRVDFAEFSDDLDCAIEISGSDSKGAYVDVEIHTYQLDIQKVYV